MNYTNSRTFNPEILYAFDPWNEETHPYNCHHHEFLEISILLEGESEYIVQGQQYHATAGTVFLFNPRTEHGEQQKSRNLLTSTTHWHFKSLFRRLSAKRISK